VQAAALLADLGSGCERVKMQRQRENREEEQNADQTSPNNLVKPRQVAEKALSDPPAKNSPLAEPGAAKGQKREVEQIVSGKPSGEGRV
jgi:hypothetical protein